MLNFKSASPLLLVLILAACASPDRGFPSLERRAYETDAPITAPAESLGAPSALSGELAAKTTALLARHGAAHNDYLRGLGVVQSAASKAAGSSPGKEAWVNAHVMLSRLDKMRSDSVGALRDFDQLLANADADDAGVTALLLEAQQPVVEDVAAQNVEIARLSRLIGE